MAGSSEYKRVIIVRRDPWALALLPLFRHRLVKYIIDFISLKCIFNIFFGSIVISLCAIIDRQIDISTRGNHEKKKKDKEFRRVGEKMRAKLFTVFADRLEDDKRGGNRPGVRVAVLGRRWD